MNGFKPVSNGLIEREKKMIRFFLEYRIHFQRNNHHHHHHDENLCECELLL